MRRILAPGPWGLAVVLLAGASLAGCTGDAVPYRLDGVFEAPRTAADDEDFQATVGRFSGDVAIKDSIPEGFAVRSLDPERCSGLRAELLGKAYISWLGECLADTAP